MDLKFKGENKLVLIINLWWSGPMKGIVWKIRRHRNCCELVLGSFFSKSSDIRLTNLWLKSSLFLPDRPEALRRFTKSKRGSRSWRTTISLCGEKTRRITSHPARLTQTMWTFELVQPSRYLCCDRELLWKPAGRKIMSGCDSFVQEPTWILLLQLNLGSSAVCTFKALFNWTWNGNNVCVFDGQPVA